ncbi:hypothetical protein GCM10009087_20980 [Sphingomonas oligophenolica]|uniref:Alpha/beta hydrolase n=1 Tax=Sphingomonas oligophenolica TaxID=301154 RepID=A0ABU9Y3U2_9SPHN
MRRAIAAAALAVILVLGLMLVFISPPGLLSLLDGAIGGGVGASRPGSAIPFGTHGETLDLWRPAGAATIKRPVLIFWYGGGWAKGDRRSYAFVARAFARHGFVVVVPDYRKVPSIRFPAFVQDGAEAVKWTRDHVAEFGGDPHRIAVAGHSAGAHIAAMLTLDTHWLKAEGVDPKIIKAAVGLSGPYDFYPYTSARAIDAMQGADPAATQPITFARADAPPMLLVTSTGDTEVRPKNAINLAAKLKELGAPVTLTVYPALSHEDVVKALSKPFRRKGPVLADSVAFLNAALKPNAP